MPSKGIDIYSYIAISNCEIIFNVPGEEVKNYDRDNFQRKHMEVDSHNISGHFNFDGEFSFRVIRDGHELTKQWNKISTMSGDLKDGTMLKISATPSIINGDVIITYGFYDAGPGDFGLTSSHQCWVTVTHIKPDWMGQIAPRDSGEARRGFGTFVLPSPHDSGMNTMDTVGALLTGNNAAQVMKTFVQYIPPLKLIANIAMPIVENIIFGLSITQKDPIPVMMLMGARYFEFRPAFCEPNMRPYCPFPDKLWFQHLCIPGTTYEEFLEHAIKFLDDHQGEFIVIRICWDGVIPQCERPKEEHLKRLAEEASGCSRSGIHVGNRDDVGRPIDDLRREGKRMLIFDSGTPKYDSYDDTANATLDAIPMIQKYESMNQDDQRRHPYTVLQAQATATNVPKVLPYSAVTSNASTSILMETKARCDNRTLPWIRDHVLDKFVNDHLLIIMNDFIDGATIETAVELSKKRFHR